MPRISLTAHLRRFVDTPSDVFTAPGATVAEALDAFFSEWPALRGYVLEDSGALRKHVTIFVDGATLLDRAALSDPVSGDSEIFITQALSGG